MNLKELEKLMKLCHKHNVKSITVDGVSLTIDSLIPPKQNFKEEPTQEKPEPEYTEEDILMWSAGQL
jgi:hypothetical protein